MLSLRRRMQCEKRIKEQGGIPSFNVWRGKAGFTKETTEKRPGARRKNRRVVMKSKSREHNNSERRKLLQQRRHERERLNILLWFFTRCVTSGNSHHCTLASSSTQECYISYCALLLWGHVVIRIKDLVHVRHTRHKKYSAVITTRSMHGRQAGPGNENWGWEQELWSFEKEQLGDKNDKLFPFLPPLSQCLLSPF